MWVARNSDGSLYIWGKRPRRSSPMIVHAFSAHVGGYWSGDVDYSAKIIDRSLFPELKRKDEPIEVELVAKNDTNHFTEENERDHNETTNI